MRIRKRSLKISELNDYILQSLSSDHLLKNIYIEGELSNLKLHSGGNLFFTLKDEYNKVRCIMFSDSIDENIIEDIKDGDKIICKGSVNYYKKDGYVSFVVTEIEKVGAGFAYQKFLELKSKLENQGYFDTSHKKDLPQFPQKIGVVTSTTGAVIRDIFYVIKRRYPAVQMIVYPSLVQGDDAPESIVSGIQYLDSKDFDLIILARGGGSYEELNAFNSEKVASAIFSAQTPIISAVGHETDFTIADFVADIRASTPSVAAEIAVPLLDDIKNTVNKINNLLRENLNRIIESKENSLEYDKNILKAYSPSKKFKDFEQKLHIKRNKLDIQIQKLLEFKKTELNRKMSKIISRNPENIFEFGGAILYTMEDTHIDTAGKLSEGMEIKLQMKDGKFIVKVMGEI